MLLRLIIQNCTVHERPLLPYVGHHPQFYNYLFVFNLPHQQIDLKSCYHLELTGPPLKL